MKERKINLGIDETMRVITPQGTVSVCVFDEGETGRVHVSVTEIKGMHTIWLGAEDNKQYRSKPTPWITEIKLIPRK